MRYYTTQIKVEESDDKLDITREKQDNKEETVEKRLRRWENFNKTQFLAKITCLHRKF